MNQLTFLFVTICLGMSIFHSKSSVDAHLMPYSAQDFNDVHDFMDVYKWSYQSSIIQRLGAVMKKYGVSKYLNLQLLHTHFKIHKNEIIVEKLTHNESITKPVFVKSVNMGSLIPYLFKFTRNGNAIPLEFVEDSEFAKYHTTMTIINSTIGDNSTSFVKEFVQTLIHLNVIDIFGLGVPHRDHIGRPFGGHTTENSNSDERWYCVFGTHGKTQQSVTPVSACAHQCSHHCNATSHVEKQQSTPVNACAHSCSHHCNSTSHEKVTGVNDCSHHSCTHGCASHCSFKNHAKKEHSVKAVETTPTNGCSHSSCTHGCASHCSFKNHAKKEHPAVETIPTNGCSHSSCTHGCASHCSFKNHAKKENHVIVSDTETIPTKVAACAHSCTHHCNSTSHVVNDHTSSCAHKCNSHVCTGHHPNGNSSVHACAHQCSHHCDTHQPDQTDETIPDDIITVQVGWSFK